MNALETFKHAIEDHFTGKPAVAVAVCSAHSDVLCATVRSAVRFNTFALIETTPAQVNLSDGYSGLPPIGFASQMIAIAEAEGLPRERLLLGADHLGPYHWRHQSPMHAMEAAAQLASEYVRAGYRKIHLDASQPLLDDPPAVPLEVAAHRCVDIAAACEEAAHEDAPVYIVGSEVPMPGGEREKSVGAPSSPENLKRTLSVFCRVFHERGLGAVWPRVMGVVVDAGVTFGDEFILDYQPLPELKKAIERYPGWVFEAHSTDYQRPVNLKRMVEDHFFILKVGPWLTYTLREALFLLELMEKELYPTGKASHFRETLFRVMIEQPVHWRGYHSAGQESAAYHLAYSYSDRCRYYLSHPEVAASRQRLLDNLGPVIPGSLISQYMPIQYRKVRSGRLPPSPRDLMIDRICEVLGYYAEAGVRESEKSGVL
jgi:D-tagatose-1,6-bisphosphate aldolase subunit GatZ/KbaZ